jgi:predicted enzyme related to lactoylglutathione lyase
MPTRDTPWPNGTPCWIDYGAADLDATKTFYASVLGWEYTGGEPEFGGYLTVTVDGRMAAGMGPQQDPEDPPRWTTYFAADDAAATAARIKDAGGTVLVEPMEVGPMGTMVIALDPQQNPFGLWQSGLNTGVQIHNEPGALAWNEAMVDDTAAAKRFYSAVFGFTFEQMDAEAAGQGSDGEAIDYATFSAGGNPLGGLGGSDPSFPKGWLTCFAVRSTDEAVAAVEAANGKVIMPGMDTPFGRFAVVEDPWGAPFEVMGPVAG